MTLRLPFTAVPFSQILVHWYQKLVLGLLCLVVAYALVGTIYYGTKFFIAKLRAFRRRASGATQLGAFERDINALTQGRETKQCSRAKSFGVYLGSLDVTITRQQAVLIAGWDIIVLDPLQASPEGVIHTAETLGTAANGQNLHKLLESCGSQSRLARVQLNNTTDTPEEQVSATYKQSYKLQDYTNLSNALQAVEKDAGFWQGILLANCSKTPEKVINSMIALCRAKNFAVFLECEAPDFIGDHNILINFDDLDGVLLRNGSLLADGQRRDYFGMAPIRKILKIAGRQLCLQKNFSLLAYESLNAGQSVPNSVLNRSYRWTTFYNCVLYVADERGQHDVDWATGLARPISAFEWLKEIDIVTAHQAWRDRNVLPTSSKISDCSSIFESLEEFFPGVTHALNSSEEVLIEMEQHRRSILHFPWYDLVHRRPLDSMSFGPTSHTFSGLGCFAINDAPEQPDFDGILYGQQNVLRLNLLKPLTATQKTQAIDGYEKLHALQVQRGSSNAEQVAALIKGLQTDQITVHFGLKTGFKSAGNVEYNGVYFGDVLFINQDVEYMSTILHTYLSSAGVSRSECLDLEFQLAEVLSLPFPTRINDEIATLSRQELLLMIQEITISRTKPAFASALISACKFQLLEVNDAETLAITNSKDYLDGVLSLSDMITKRIDWYRNQKLNYIPCADLAIPFLDGFETRVANMLKEGRLDFSKKMIRIAAEIMSEPETKLTPSTDLFLLCLFSAFKFEGIEEVYLEGTDRCPVQNQQSDQAAVFAEFWALGSNCESYFGCRPMMIGEILAKKYRTFYAQNQPDRSIEAGTLATVYMSSQTDVDQITTQKEKPMTFLEQLNSVQALGIYAVPALVDITLLTTTGRGLYLSSFMKPTESNMATYAFVASLLFCGGVNASIEIGGSFYLYAMVYPTMSIYTATRLIASITMAIVLALTVFIGAGISSGFQESVIFLLYTIALSTYLTIIGLLSIFHFKGSPLRSGRRAIARCFLILTISPLLTSFVHDHDIYIYLTVIYCFVTALIYETRKVICEWTTWLEGVVSISDQEMMDWHAEFMPEDEKTFLKEQTAPAVLQAARLELTRQVLAELGKWSHQKQTADKKVADLANCFYRTDFLLTWYCRYVQTPKALPYTTTWNLQTKVAVNTLRGMDKGLRLHSGLSHWRRSRRDIGSALLYFVIALLDRWTELLSGGRLVGFAVLGDTSVRIGICLGLIFYLMGAFLLDIQVQPLYVLLSQTNKGALDNAADLENIRHGARKGRRSVYMKHLSQLSVLLAYSLIVSTGLLLGYTDSQRAVFLYLAYAASYLGLLLFQYNRLFFTTKAGTFNILLFSSILGFSVGLPLRNVYPDWPYNDVVGLGCATWCAAILSFVHLGLYSSIIPRTIYSSLPVAKEVVSNDNLAVKARKILQSSQDCEALESAFPSGLAIIRDLIDDWECSRIKLSLYPAALTRNISATTESGIVHFFYTPCKDDAVTHRHVYLAELLLAEYASSVHGINRSDADCLSSWFDSPDGIVELPKVVRSTISQMSRERLTEEKRNSRINLLNALLPEFDADRQWKTLSRAERELIVSFIAGEPQNMIFDSQHLPATLLRDVSGMSTEIWQERVSLAIASEMTRIAYIEECDRKLGVRHYLRRQDDIYEKLADEVALFSKNPTLKESLSLKVDAFLHILSEGAKYLFHAFLAETDYQKELARQASSSWFKIPIIFFFTTIWRFSRTIHEILLPYMLFKDQAQVAALLETMRRGVKKTLAGSRLEQHKLKGPTTAFILYEKNGEISLNEYKGLLTQEPPLKAGIVTRNLYDERRKLTRRTIYADNGKIKEDYYYAFQGSSRVKTQMPYLRVCIVGPRAGENAFYDQKGFITSGDYVQDERKIHYECHYRKYAKSEHELLAVTYNFTKPDIELIVTFSYPSQKHPEQKSKWIPFARPTSVVYRTATATYDTKYVYDHKCHPIVSTTCDGKDVETPDEIRHDWFKVLTKPVGLVHYEEDPLRSFSTLKPGLISRLLRRNTQFIEITTSTARTHLWNTWKTTNSLSGVTARWLDEIALRSDPLMKPYWRARDAGNMSRASRYCLKNIDAIMASVDVDHQVSSWTLLAYKVSDLITLGRGGEVSMNTRKIDSQVADDKDQLHVFASDMGTWPNEGGGVSCCRRDLVDNIQKIKWHVISENANDYGVPKFQIEENVMSLKILPLWGLDFLPGGHGIFEDGLDSEIAARIRQTTDSDIRAKFFPILRLIVSSSRMISYTKADMKLYTNMLLQLNFYFESRDWATVWQSDVVKDEWQRLWVEDMPGALNLPDYLDIEKPSLENLEESRELFMRYLFIFSIPLPAKIPNVFQSTHHSVGAAYGILAKLRRGASFHIWDHCVIWRELNTYLSSAQCTHPSFTRNSLTGLLRIFSILNLYHADVILPCTNTFNPGWETDIGTQQDSILPAKKFLKKIDPVTNGICNMESFDPIETITTTIPTVTMLSHVNPVKDIKAAILAADIIINEYGFRDYQLLIYGGLDKTPPYTVECQELIAARSLGKYVKLMGLGSPNSVLQKTWLFLNSSVSEGLPLAIGEAALTGAPIVCTDVGATFQVLRDSDFPDERLGEVVAPNDHKALARAQLRILAMMETWEKHAADPEPFGPLPDVFSGEDVARITARMYAKQDNRRALGMKLRAVVQKNFSGDRYLREHEQMLYLGRYRYEANKLIEQVQRGDIRMSVVSLGVPPETFRDSQAQIEPFDNGSARSSVSTKFGRESEGNSSDDLGAESIAMRQMDKPIDPFSDEQASGASFKEVHEQVNVYEV